MPERLIQPFAAVRDAAARHTGIMAIVCITAAVAVSYLAVTMYRHGHPNAFALCTGAAVPLILTAAACYMRASIQRAQRKQRLRQDSMPDI